MDSRYPSLAFSHAPAGMAIVDAAARAMVVNPALCRLTGRSAEALCAAPLPSVGLGVPADAAVVPLFRGQRGVLVSFDYSAHLLHGQRVRDTGASLTLVFAATYTPPEPRHDLVVAYLQKGKDEIGRAHV